MKSNAFILALACTLSGSSLALAAEGDKAAADPRVTSTSADLNAAVTCFKLQQPANLCAIVGKPIVNYVAPAFNVIDLNGAWAGPGNERPYIYLYGDSQYSAGYTIAIDMSLLNRPDAFGYFVDETTIVVVFPDDADYTGTLDGSGTIRWSNNTVWTKR
jgi:hypothetical protein